MPAVVRHSSSFGWRALAALRPKRGRSFWQRERRIENGSLTSGLRKRAHRKWKWILPKPVKILQAIKVCAIGALVSQEGFGPARNSDNLLNIVVWKVFGTPAPPPSRHGRLACQVGLGPAKQKKAITSIFQEEAGGFRRNGSRPRGQPMDPASKKMTVCQLKFQWLNYIFFLGPSAQWAHAIFSFTFELNIILVLLKTGVRMESTVCLI